MKNSLFGYMTRCKSHAGNRHEVVVMKSYMLLRILKENTCSSTRSADSQRTARQYILGDRTFHTTSDRLQYRPPFDHMIVSYRFPSNMFN